MAPTEKTEEVKQSAAAAPPHRAKVHGFFSLCMPPLTWCSTTTGALQQQRQLTCENMEISFFHAYTFDQAVLTRPIGLPCHFL